MLGKYLLYINNTLYKASTRKFTLRIDNQASYINTKRLIKLPEALDSFQVASLKEAAVMPSITAFAFLCTLISLVASHGPPKERDQEDITMGRKNGAKWCSMAKVCNHDRVPVCGVSHAGDVIGFRDLCDMFDFNCIRKRNYKQTSCPADRNFLTASRKPTNIYYDE